MLCFCCKNNKKEIPQKIGCFLARKSNRFFWLQPGICNDCFDLEAEWGYGPVRMKELFSEYEQETMGAFKALRAADDLGVWSEELERLTKEELYKEWIFTARGYYNLFKGISDQVDDAKPATQEEIEALLKY